MGKRQARDMGFRIAEVMVSCLSASKRPGTVHGGFRGGGQRDDMGLCSLFCHCLEGNTIVFYMGVQLW